MIRYRGQYPANDQSIILVGLSLPPVPEIEYSTSKVPKMPGLIPIDKTHNSRSINATYQLNGKTPEENMALLAQLARWAESAYEEHLTLDERPGFYFLATLAGASESDLSQMWPEVTLTFACPYPYLLSSDLKSASVGSAFQYNGDILAWPIITFTPTTDTEGTQWSNGDQIITIEHTIMAGHTITVDNGKHTIMDNGESIMQHLDLLSDWISIAKGENTITGTGGLVQWREICL
jgi:predicted phage tail component-like protein